MGRAGLSARMGWDGPGWAERSEGFPVERHATVSTLASARLIPLVVHDIV